MNATTLQNDKARNCRIEVGENQPPEQRTDLAGFRIVVLTALIASIGITWPLWNLRQSPPLLPAIGLPELSLGVPLLVACIGALFAPRFGVIVLTVLVVYGMATDQTRMQPEFFSLPLLLWGSFPLEHARLLARAHLISLWFYSGLHKLLSPGFLAGAGSHLVQAFPLAVPERFVAASAIGIAMLEIGIAVFALWPATRRQAAWLAFALHIGVVLVLSARGEGRNLAVWPWNIALACSGFALIAPWKTSLGSDLVSAPLVGRVTVGILLFAPLGFYAGIVDAYPANQLYSSGTASETTYCPRGCRPEQDVNATWFALNVPLPPEPRLYLATFAKTCAPGDVLRIGDPHPPPWIDKRQRGIHPCPAGSLPASHP
jgi:hypothetical protein